MTDQNAPFAPDWVSPPGDTILDMVEERGWTQAELAVRLGFSPKHVNQVIKGKAPLTEESALRLAPGAGTQRRLLADARSPLPRAGRTFGVHQPPCCMGVLAR